MEPGLIGVKWLIWTHLKPENALTWDWDHATNLIQLTMVNYVRVMEMKSENVHKFHRTNSHKAIIIYENDYNPDYSLINAYTNECDFKNTTYKNFYLAPNGAVGLAFHGDLGQTYTVFRIILKNSRNSGTNNR